MKKFLKWNKSYKKKSKMKLLCNIISVVAVIFDIFVALCVADLYHITGLHSKLYFKEKDDVKETLE